MSKQLDGISGRATRATAPDAVARVPSSEVDAVKLMAAQRKAGWTVRRVLLQALKSFGVEVPEGELCDRRR